MNRPTSNQIEIDYLPPYGVPEVNFIGDVAIIVGTAFAFSFILKSIEAS